MENNKGMNEKREKTVIISKNPNEGTKLSEKKELMYLTCDLYLAAFLMAQKFDLLHIRRKNGRVYFAFRESTERNNASYKYYTRAAVIEPLSFVDSIKNLKAMIYNL